MDIKNCISWLLAGTMFGVGIKGADIALDKMLDKCERVKIKTKAKKIKDVICNKDQ